MNTEQERSELLPCPFCGGEPYMEQWGNNRQSCIIACQDCGCSMETGETGHDCGGMWNQRAALQSQDAEDAADMFWDADDTEDCLYAYDEEAAVERMVEKAWPTDFPLHFTLQRAVRLPSVNIKVTSMSECGTDIQYEREAIDHARRVEGDVSGH